jgi:hypothetical protein
MLMAYLQALGVHRNSPELLGMMLDPHILVHGGLRQKMLPLAQYAALQPSLSGSLQPILSDRKSVYFRAHQSR